MTSARVVQALERLGEDGTLTGDLADPEATAALAWAEQQIVAADHTADDNAFADRVAAIRAAIRAAARSMDDPIPITQRAERALRDRAPESDSLLLEPAIQVPGDSAAVAAIEPSGGSATAPLPAPSRRSWSRIPRRKARRWTSRKAV